MHPNRVVAVATAALTLTLAILPVVGNMDWTSTAGVLAGITAVLAIVLKWLDGYQKHEERAAADPSLNADLTDHQGADDAR